MSRYGLSFIRDEDLFQHVQQTMDQYRFQIDLKEFNRNLVDPIKLSFDAKVYGKSLATMIEAEVVRQMDKSNTNHIGYFHQNIFNYLGQGWEVPSAGFDVINAEKHCYVELKNKHNTMNSASSQKTYMRMQHTILRDDQATCLLVEVIAKASQDKPWVISLDGERVENRHIRRVSMDKFYALVTGDPHAFFKLCQVLPSVMDDVLASKMEATSIQSTVYEELAALSPDVLKSLYLLAFEKYDGFDALK